MTRVLQALSDEGYPVTPEIIARLAPYQIGHMNRFGHYDLRFAHPPPPITAELRRAPARAVS
jgi:Tn3 transposase DDE domain